MGTADCPHTLSRPFTLRPVKRESSSVLWCDPFSLGVATNRDDWVYDADVKALTNKVQHFISVYNAEVDCWVKAGRPKDIGSWVSREIKWTSELEAHLKTGTKLSFNQDRVRNAAYRPFCPTHTYYDRVVTHRLYKQDEIFPVGTPLPNRVIIFTGPAAQKPWMVSAVDRLPDLHYVGAAAGAVCLPRYPLQQGRRAAGQCH
jgi:predicted helicase